MYAGEDVDVDIEKEKKKKCVRLDCTHSEFETLRAGRRVCNHCKWLYYVKPSRERRILRELEQKHRFHPTKP